MPLHPTATLGAEKCVIELTPGGIEKTPFVERYGERKKWFVPISASDPGSAAKTRPSPSLFLCCSLLFLSKNDGTPPPPVRQWHRGISACLRILAAFAASPPPVRSEE